MAFNPDHMDWYEARGTAPRGTLVVCHGLSEHRGRYADWAAFMAARGWNLLTLDLPGHGASAEHLGYPGAAGWKDFENRILSGLTVARDTAPEVPVWLVGHSMGSFAAATVVLRDDFPTDCAGVVLVGTDRSSRGQALALRSVSGLLSLFGKPERPSLLLEALIFGGYQRHFSRRLRGFDWLNPDPASVAAFEADPLCGHSPSLRLWQVLAQGLSVLGRPDLPDRWPEGLPALILAGSDDPVGHFGKGPEKLARALSQRGRTVDLHLFPGVRHELLQPGNPEKLWTGIAERLEALSSGSGFG